LNKWSGTVPPHLLKNAGRIAASLAFRN